MDGDRFDRLTRPYAKGPTRRRVIHQLAALGLGALGFAGGSTRAAAVAPERCKKSCPCRKNESKQKCKRRCKRKCDW